MKTPSLTAFAGLCFFSVASALAQDLTPPKVAHPLPDVTVGAEKKQSVINLTRTFALDGVTGQIVRMASVLGPIDVEMLAADAPKNVANFLSYVNSGAYNKSFINRSEPGFVIQGGGYTVDGSGQLEAVPTKAPVAGEHLVSNTVGTLALALEGGANSANSGTNQWFFNLANNNGTTPNNPNLDDGSNNQGPFTVFGRVIEADLTTLKAIAALPVENLSSNLGENFEDVPLYDYTSGATVTVSNLVYLDTVALIPLVPASPGGKSVLTLSVKNNKPNLLMATISGHKLKLIYKPGKTGMATIKVIARDSAGSSVTSHFTVTIK